MINWNDLAHNLTDWETELPLNEAEHLIQTAQTGAFDALDPHALHGMLDAAFRHEEPAGRDIRQERAVALS